ncbi:MAG: hydroxyacid dehydrogenase [Planctomycetes bacterium]|nr:hydroxyacid dehydrogenase [Planctomycetota bacterium]
MTAFASQGPSAASNAGPAKVLVCDPIAKSGLDALRGLGCLVMNDPELAEGTLARAVKDTAPEVLITGTTPVTAEAIAASPRLAMIVVAGTGTEHVDVAAASRRGIFVANCPGRNATAVAELAWALILGCDRRLPEQVEALRAGHWRRRDFAQAAGLHGRTLGIVGLGQVGQEIAGIGRAFGMDVIAWSRNLTEEKALEHGCGFCGSLLNLAKLSEVVSVSVGGGEDTDNLINDKFIAALKPNAILVNTSRGGVIEQAALRNAVRTRGLRVGLDVWAEEPEGHEGTFADPLVHEAGVIGTHHVGALTEQAQRAVADEVVRVVRAWTERGHVPNCVNRAVATPATNLLAVRHVNRPGVLAHVFEILGEASINVEEMENIVYAGGEAGLARIQVAKAPSEDQLKAIRANANILSATLSTITRRM